VAHAKAGAAEQLGAGVKKQLRRGVIELLGVHRLHDRNVIQNVGQVLPDFAEPYAVPAVLGEFERRTKHFRHAFDEGESFALEEFIRAILSVEPDQRRLVIEQIKLRRRAGHMQIDD
jgi:hypothetical protein